jgi:hypothetical protein
LLEPSFGGVYKKGLNGSRVEEAVVSRGQTHLVSEKERRRALVYETAHILIFKPGGD